MALGDDYATLVQLKSYMKNELTQDDAELTDALESASEAINLHTKRQFNKVTSATARTYKRVDAEVVFVDDFWTTIGLVLKTDDDDDGVFETTWAASDYELRPRNGIRNGLPGWPYYEIAAVGSRRFPCTRRASVEVTAQWGWDAVPDNVHQACLELASSIYAMRHSRLGVAGSDQFGSIIRVSDNKVAEGKLRRFRRLGVSGN